MVTLLLSPARLRREGLAATSRKADPKIIEISLLTFLLYVINLTNSVNKS